MSDYIMGSDISSYQPSVDWESAYQDGHRFAIIKSSQYIKDKSFDRNSSEAHNAGIIVGAYHFGVPGYKTPEYQAGFMASIIVNTPVKFAALDIETSNGFSVYQLRDWTSRFIKELQSLVTIPVGVYSDLSYLASLYPSVADTGCFLWPADLSNAPTSYQGVSMHDWKFWQYSWSGRLPGVNGDVDFDYWYSDLTSLQEFANTVVDPTNPSRPVIDPTDPTNNQEDDEVAGGIGSLCGYNKTKAVYLLTAGGKMRLSSKADVALATKLGAGNVVWTDSEEFLNNFYDIPSRVSIEADNAGRTQTLLGKVGVIQSIVTALKGKK